MAKPEIEIDVDPATGQWFVDKMPMILVPQHFYNNNHFALEAALGAEGLDAALAPAGRTSAYVWCKKQSEVYGLSGLDVFAHYMKRLSQRGWGRFTIVAADPAAGTATIRLDHSSFITDESRKAGRRLCYMFAPWLKGAMEFVCEQDGMPRTLVAEEVQCAAEGHDHCVFEVRPA
ncbi:4-vinyl reductase [Aquabacter sp. L1I39]|uniref:4-vinyl reductase n=1 Tax=Aquabacter sp. L1I39 TaxID=2820278 RepID=UPI001ADC2BD1|nr:4-vinyl reductase [Aquabacter sp. L1I39]QTL04167.1 4-vinyl reductase [Aquabacter sp. L1I39]